MKETISLESYKDIIASLQIELEFMSRHYDIPLEALNSSIEKLSNIECIYDPKEVTTPFSDDLGTEDNYHYPKELGEVEDVFNVEINCNGDNHIVLTRRIIRASQDDGSYLQSMVNLLGKLKP